MKKRAGFVVACAAGLALCGCVPQAELEAARAETAAARAEAEQLRAELEALKGRVEAGEKAKNDARAADEKAKADEKAAKMKAAALEEEMRTRWNAVPAAGANIALPVVNMGNFKWTGANAFPHPTFKGGSEEAYTAFAKVLVAFLETGDNFEFMQKNDLFKTEFGFGGTGKITFVTFGAQLAQPGSLASGDKDNQKKLSALVAKMKAPRKL